MNRQFSTTRRHTYYGYVQFVLLYRNQSVCLINEPGQCLP